MKKYQNFTLIELMVVVIIVAILAAAAVPIYLGQSRRAKTTEAVAGCGAMRSAERTYYSEHESYLAVGAGNAANQPTDANPGLGLDFTSNTYYDAAAFSVATDATHGFVVTCSGGGSGAPRASDVSSMRVEMRGNGTTRYSYDGGTSYTNWE